MDRPASFDALLLRYLPGLKAAAARMSASRPHLAEDLVAETAARALERWQAFRPDGGFYKWLIFELRSVFRSQHLADRVSREAADVFTTSHPALVTQPAQEHAAALAQTLRLVDAMPGRRGPVLRLAALGFTDAEIGERVCGNRPNIQIMRIRALRRLNAIAA